uniref:Cytosol aminopeptidase domain-containing protein n=1 Tax=Chromera velia CCMP2878 TaxID=1169474 RepID=A0A0G4HIC6_9ALVE|eukprot:Cvel_27868.t1-p1 / transcript=Cvel_27868.t1 / gene=Cvel_27868 / organism=Chromera_velia_CCMP2878 / gene_product=Probable aminopeptidase NPEPL1, putative / transcript_product=Probable aminopeptidase NPEPL1, putative / location=Cvel_scaffold3547:1698-4679(+) / protein_length=514 / sequence_SO=supercontig / SO=protein_coding / is_pseudo=false
MAFTPPTPKHEFEIVPDASSVASEGWAPSILVFTGTKALLQSETVSKLLPSSSADTLKALLEEKGKAGENGSSVSTYVKDASGKFVQVVFCVLPDSCSRSNCPAQPHAISSLTAPFLSDGSKSVGVLLCLADTKYAVAGACSIARNLPLFLMKTKGMPEKGEQGTVRVGFGFPSSSSDSLPLGRVFFAAQGVRLAAKIVDMHPEVMNTVHFQQEAQKAVERMAKAGFTVKTEVIEGEALRDRGFGGIWGVGRAGTHPPRLVILSYEPPAAKTTVAMVGKGVVYDSGGLSLKIGGTMCGMKCDCGGAAAVLGSFEAAVSSKVAAEKGVRLHALLCLAENCIGPSAYRNDDILTLYSGKTVEINNTDAEGRLLLGDGVAYATKQLAPDMLIDMATSTGAQMVTTGKKHAGVMTNSERAEKAFVQAGVVSGDVAHPMLYAPEFLKSESKSVVADMKNSVKDRMNAQSSCAGTFVGEHIADSFEGEWVHLDIAGPAWSDKGGTGYGVALIVEMLNAAK